MAKIYKLTQRNLPKITITFICSMLLSGCLTESTSSPTPTYKTYSENKISFQYPTDYSISTDEELKPEANGPDGKLIIITLKSPDSSVIIEIDLVEDPLADIMFPGQYPPSETLLRILVAGEIGNLNISKSQVNESAGKEAIDNAEIKPISGQHAALFKAQFEKEQYGELYLRGAVVVTENRTVYIKMLGISGVSQNRTVNSEYIDDMWSQLINTISITY